MIKQVRYFNTALAIYCFYLIFFGKRPNNDIDAATALPYKPACKQRPRRSPFCFWRKTHGLAPIEATRNAFLSDPLGGRFK
jgi:hypothetical protein